MFESIQSALTLHGIPFNYPLTDESEHFLAVPLWTDEFSREYVLVIEAIPDESGTRPAISMTLVFPFCIHDPKIVPQLARTLLLLNHYVPIGHHGLNESPLSLYFRHRFLIGSRIEPSQIVDPVLMISHFMRSHCQILEGVIESTVSYEDIVDQLRVLEPAVAPFSELVG